MSKQNYFDPSYVSEQQTAQPTKEKSEVKRLLKEGVNEEEMSRYGSSKPRRIVIRGKILHDKD